jgi:hypothetical protein
MKPNEMGGSCGTYGGCKRGLDKILLGTPEGEIHLEDLGIDGRIILKWIYKTWDREA